MINLYTASNQWANRPIDETYWGLADALVAARHIKDTSATALVPYSTLHVEGQGAELALVGATGTRATPTYSACAQLCTRAHVPHSLIARQPGELAAQNLNWGLAQYKDGDDRANLLFNRNGKLVLRAATSETYERLYHVDYLSFLHEHLGPNWLTPPAKVASVRQDDPRARVATESDLAPFAGMTRVQVGDTIAPAGIYMSDKDLFIFLVCKGNEIDGPSGQLNRFIIAFNNEIGTGSWGFIAGLFDKVCGNHIIYNATNVKELRVRHVGERNTLTGMRKMRIQLRQYADSSASETEALLGKSATFEIASTKEDVLEAVFNYGRKTRIPELTMNRISDAYDKAEQVGRYGSPRTPWALSSGLTELSQESQYADERLALDKAAGKVLEMAF